jgi:hypothetical protein
VIQTEIQSDIQEPSDEVGGKIQFGPTLYDGNFIWTSKTETTETEAHYTTNQLTICRSTEYYSKDEGKCEACPSEEGTTGFQQRTCESCGTMWFNESEEPESLEFLTAYELCDDPE